MGIFRPFPRGSSPYQVPANHNHPPLNRLQLDGLIGWFNTSHITLSFFASSNSFSISVSVCLAFFFLNVRSTFYSSLRNFSLDSMSSKLQSPRKVSHYLGNLLSAAAKCNFRNSFETFKPFQIGHWFQK